MDAEGHLHLRAQSPWLALKLQQQWAQRTAAHF
jgi:hypothetical protein